MLLFSQFLGTYALVFSVFGDVCSCFLSFWGRMLLFSQFLGKCVQFWNSHKLYIEVIAHWKIPCFPLY